jgi:fructose-bisphosphate aldolase class II
MAMISLRQLLDHAAEHGYGVPAFNANNLEQIQAIMQAAQKTDSPVILQASAGARKYAGEPFLRKMVEAAAEMYPDIPIVLHQDHGASPSVCIQSIRSGFTSVMMDGSLREDAKTPASYEYNVDVTRRVCEMAHAIGVSVEGELGCLGSLESGQAGEEDGVGAEGTLTHDQMLTDPDQAADFVRKTGVDALAIAIGTSHGAYKFSRKPTGDILAIDRIKQIHAKIPGTHLVMHGSSSVPQEWLAIIRENGGDIKETYGVPVEEIQEGIRHGVRKINIDDAPGDEQGPQRVRPAQVPQGRHRRGARRLHRAHAGLRLRGHGLAHQAGAAGGGGEALQLNRLAAPACPQRLVMTTMLSSPALKTPCTSFIVAASSWSGWAFSCGRWNCPDQWTTEPPPAAGLTHISAT